MTAHRIVLPDPPVPPEPGECCGSGCTPCVFDLYEEALARHRALVEASAAPQAADDADTSGR